MNNKAFSLIELMVVIAIVALLAVVAVPAYKSYLFKAKITPIVQYAEHIADEMFIYYDTNGEHSDQLSDYGYTRVDPPATGINTVAPNIPFLTQDASGTPNNTCPTREFMVGFAGLDGDKQLPDFLGGSSTTYGHAGYLIYSLFVNAQGMKQVACFYYMFEDGVMSTDDVQIGDCYNYAAAMNPGTDAEAGMQAYATASNAC